MSNLVDEDHSVCLPCPRAGFSDCRVFVTPAEIGLDKLEEEPEFTAAQPGIAQEPALIWNCCLQEVLLANVVARLAYRARESVLHEWEYRASSDRISGGAQLDT